MMMMRLPFSKAISGSTLLLLSGILASLVLIDSSNSFVVTLIGSASVTAESI